MSNTNVSHSGGHGLKFQYGYWLSYPEVIYGFSQSLILSQDCFLPHPSQFILVPSCYTFEGTDRKLRKNKSITTHKETQNCTRNVPVSVFYLLHLSSPHPLQYLKKFWHRYSIVLTMYNELYSQ